MNFDIDDNKPLKKTRLKRSLHDKHEPKTKPESGSDIAGFDLHNMSYNQVAICFGVTRNTIIHWAKDGCPKTNKNTLDLPMVIKWKMAKVAAQYEAESKDTDELKKEKLVHEIEKLKAGNEIMREKTIPREEHEKIFSQMGSYVKSTMESAIVENGTQFVGLRTLAESTGQLRLLFQHIFKKMKDLARESK